MNSSAKRNAQKIPASVIIVTKNEERRIGKCIVALQPYFDDIVVLDSRSWDETQHIASSYCARVEDFIWNEKYPKKRQWSLETLGLAHDWVFFVDADEIMTSGLGEAMAQLDLSEESSYAGFFIRGQYMWEGKLLKHGMSNNKIALLHRFRMEFPKVNDLSLPGMGELEGHYQPVLKETSQNFKIGEVSQGALIHEAGQGWMGRHKRYAVWEAGMNALEAWPRDPSAGRERLKKIFRALPFRGWVAFFHSYVFKFGFLDGIAGVDFAMSRRAYYRMISDASKDLEGVYAEGL
ncbi:MAG: glycosyltransferase family 2 protein [Micavibrio sp.]|nr:glycosyltransferase family 2 protein [Micavibrio sp.]